MPEYRKEWMAKAKIDYFAPFVNLWLSCNAWYMDHYSELDHRDRVHIDKVKTDNSARNHLYKRFKLLMDSANRDGEIFRMNIEQFHFSLEQAAIESDSIGRISFESAVCNYDHKEAKTNLICRPRIKANGDVFVEDAPSVIKLDTVYVTSDIPTLFSGLFEIIYQVRNCLVHGKMNPGEVEYQVVKYGYLLLFDLMSF